MTSAQGDCQYSVRATDLLWELISLGRKAAEIAKAIR